MRKNERFLLGLVVFLFVIAAVGCSSGSQAPAGTQPGGNTAVTANSAAPASSLDGKALAEERCSACHSYSRVENAKKTPQEWDATVKRMIDHGASLNAAEQAAVTDYLSATYK